MSALGIKSRHSAMQSPWPLYPQSGRLQYTRSCLLWAKGGYGRLSASLCVRYSFMQNHFDMTFQRG
jgi:hypothetical protein